MTAKTALRCAFRGLRTSASARAITPYAMPSMSPTMEEGKISQWRVEQGGSFKSGDVLLSIETDKAEIDVEAQEDGILAKILKQDGEGSIKVGEAIAFLAEEGDDLSQMPESAASESAQAEPSKPESSGSTSDQPVKSADTSAQPKSSGSHASHDLVHGLKPSVQRLLLQSNDKSTDDIRAFLSATPKPTKGDVLAFLGKIQSAHGSLTSQVKDKISMSPFGKDGKAKGVQLAGAQKTEAAEPETPLDAAGLKRLIIQGMALKAKPKAVVQPAVAQPAGSEHDYDELFAAYLPPPPARAASIAADRLAAKNRITPLPNNDPLNDLFV